MKKTGHRGSKKTTLSSKKKRAKKEIEPLFLRRKAGTEAEKKDNRKKKKKRKQVQTATEAIHRNAEKILKQRKNKIRNDSFRREMEGGESVVQDNAEGSRWTPARDQECKRRWKEEKATGHLLRERKSEEVLRTKKKTHKNCRGQRGGGKGYET